MFAWPRQIKSGLGSLSVEITFFPFLPPPLPLSLSLFLPCGPFFFLISTNFEVFLLSLLVLNFSLLSSLKLWFPFDFCLFIFSYFQCDHTGNNIFFLVVFNGHSGPNSILSHWSSILGMKKTSSKKASCIFINFLPKFFPIYSLAHSFFGTWRSLLRVNIQVLENSPLNQKANWSRMRRNTCLWSQILNLIFF